MHSNDDQSMKTSLDAIQTIPSRPFLLVTMLTCALTIPCISFAARTPCSESSHGGKGPACVIDPTKTGSGISKVVDMGQPQFHRVWVHQGHHALQRLLVFLAGSTDTTTDYDKFASQASRDGYDVIVLAYHNERTINSYCKQLAEQGADKCWAESRGEVSFGRRTAIPGVIPSPGYRWPKIDVTAADSSMGRLVSRLDYRGTHSGHSGRTWRQYVHADPASPYHGRMPTSRRIVIAGHSQGGGHAAFIAHHLKFARVLTFSSPADYHTTDFVKKCTPAAWLKQHSKTPINRYYGFEDVHSFTFGCDKPGWDAMGYKGAPRTSNIDAGPPSGNRHELVTRDNGHSFPDTTTDGCARGAHSCVIADRVTPLKANGKPIFGPVWRYMYGVRSNDRTEGAQ